MPHLFDPVTIREITFRNRIVVSPMCEYSSTDGFANDWHLVHLGSRAVGGAGLVITEACAVSAEGRISPHDLGIYRDEHVEKLRAITDFVHANGAVAGIQLAHAGRKASTARPWDGGAYVSPEAGGWIPLAPSPIPFAATYGTPREMTLAEIAAIPDAFVAATKRAMAAGFRTIEIHAAHGYLFGEFASPLANSRTDAYGGSFEHRTRLLCETVEAVRSAMPAGIPLFVRISASDWAPGGWDLDDSVRLSAMLASLGVDVLDASSGGTVAHQKIDVKPNYQVPFAERIRAETGMKTGAVGLITEPEQADAVIREGRADLVFLARQLLRDPYWPLHAAHALGVGATWPVQYDRAKVPLASR